MKKIDGIKMLGFFSFGMSIAKAIHTAVILTIIIRHAGQPIFKLSVVGYKIISLPILTILFFIAGVGLMRVKSYGRKMLLILVVYSLLEEFVSLFFAEQINWTLFTPYLLLSFATSLLAYGWVIRYLMYPDIKKKFK